jgi:hypothetical protein
MKTKAALIDYALAKAATDPDKAEDVLAFFCDAVENYEYPDRRILEHFAKAFRAILAGENASDALGLTRRQGQRRERTLQQADERNFDLALAVARRMKADEKRDDAIEAVAKEKGSGEATVKRAYELHRRTVRDLEKKPRSANAERQARWRKDHPKAPKGA